LLKDTAPGTAEPGKPHHDLAEKRRNHVISATT